MNQGPATDHVLIRAMQWMIAPIDAFSRWSGRLVAWLTLAMALVTAVVVLVRYGFGFNSIALQESVLYMHSTVFLLGAAFTLKSEGHVRVDIFYRRFSPVNKAWVDALGNLLFLLPVCGFILFSGWSYVTASWRIGEVSPEPGGLPAVFLLKSLIPLAAGMLALQGLAEVLRSAITLVTDGAIAKERNNDPHV